MIRLLCLKQDHADILSHPSRCVPALFNFYDLAVRTKHSVKGDSTRNTSIRVEYNTYLYEYEHSWGIVMTTSYVLRVKNG